MIRVTVAYSPAPREVHEWIVELGHGATVADAVAASGLAVAFPGMDWQGMPLGVWGRKAGLQRKLQAQDRVEIYRALRVDPKIARRERFRGQGVRAAGLFNRRR